MTASPPVPDPALMIKPFSLTSTQELLISGVGLGTGK
jgi:hypothetical protein